MRVDGKLRATTWEDAFAHVARRLDGVPGDRIAALAGDLCDVESMFALKSLMAALGSPNIDCRQDGARFDAGARVGWLFNTTIAGIEQADAILLIGTNPRWEAPIINARIRKRYLAAGRGGLTVGVVGPRHDLTYPARHLGAGPQTLQEVAEGRHEFCEVLRNAKRPMLILGMGALRRADGPAVQAAARRIADGFGMIQDDWNGFNLLHTAAARVGGLEIDFLPGQGGRDLEGILAGAGAGEIEAVYLLGADEIDTARLGDAFVIYQGHHGDRGAHRADVILPGAAYTEKNAWYVNTEGRAQAARMATFPPGEAREDWKILRALSEHLGHRLPFDTLSQIRRRLAGTSPVFADIEQVVAAPWQPFGGNGPMEPAPFRDAVGNYYMTDPISRASATMAKCTETFVLPAQEKTGTHG